jgi:hypothetical protein
MANKRGRCEGSKRKRGNAEGSIYHMKDGRWRAAVMVGWKNRNRWQANARATRVHRGNSARCC